MAMTVLVQVTGAAARLAVRVNDLLRLAKCIVDVNGIPEEAVKCIRISEGADGCTVGFVPRFLLKSKKFQEKIAEKTSPLVQVVELYAISENTQKRHKSHKKHGMAACNFLTDILISE